jgi:hypothetical protein
LVHNIKFYSDSILEEQIKAQKFKKNLMKELAGINPGYRPTENSSQGSKTNLGSHSGGSSDIQRLEKLSRHV